MKTFTATSFQRKPADIFNAVQADSFATIESNSRPAMTIMLEAEYLSMKGKVKQLTDMIKKMDGDSHKQKDLLK